MSWAEERDKSFSPPAAEKRLSVGDCSRLKSSSSYQKVAACKTSQCSVYLMDLDFLCIKIFLNLVEDSGESDDMYVSRWSIVTGNINEHCDWNGNHSYCLYKECEYSFIHSMKPTEHLFEIGRESFPELISREGNLQCLEELNSLWNEICLVPFLLPWFLLNISHLDWGKSFNSFIEQLHKIPIYTNRFDWVKGEDTLKNNIWIMLDILEKSIELFLFFKISKGSP